MRPSASNALATIMVGFSAHRSTNTPASEPSRICGTNDVSTISADAVVEPVSA